MQLLAIASTSGKGNSSPWALILVGIVFVIIGGMNAVNPALGWRASRWQYKNKQALEPSNAGLVMARVMGSVFAVIGIVLIVVGISK